MQMGTTFIALLRKTEDIKRLKLLQKVQLFLIPIQSFHLEKHIISKLNHTKKLMA